MSATIAELIERVGRASEPSQELDEAIHAVLRSDDERWQRICEGRRLVASGQSDQIIVDSKGNTLRADSWAESARVASYTSSIDAALALVERFRDQGIDAATLLSDALDRLTREGFRLDQPLAPQLARALLIEFLTALQSQTPGPTGASNEGGR